MLTIRLAILAIFAALAAAADYRPRRIEGALTHMRERRRQARCGANRRTSRALDERASRTRYTLYGARHRARCALDKVADNRRRTVEEVRAAALLAITTAPATAIASLATQLTTASSDS